MRTNAQKESKHRENRALIVYAQNLIQNAHIPFSVDIYPVDSTTYYSAVLKHAIDKNGHRTILSAELFLNLEELQTNEMIRKAIAHELVHLLPRKKRGSFDEKWRKWEIELEKLDSVKQKKWGESEIVG